MNYERLLTYGNLIPLELKLDERKVKEEIAGFEFTQYNKSKPSNPRYGLSITSEDGRHDGRDLDSLHELSVREKKMYTEMDFVQPTEVYKTSKEVQKVCEPFKEGLGRTHFLSLKTGGYFPPHRDDRGTASQDTFRIIVPIQDCNPPQCYFILEGKPLHFEPGRAYFMNTNLTHSVFSFSESNLMIVMNVSAEPKLLKKIPMLALNC